MRSPPTILPLAASGVLHLVLFALAAWVIPGPPTSLPLTAALFEPAEVLHASLAEDAPPPTPDPIPPEEPPPPPQPEPQPAPPEPPPPSPPPPEPQPQRAPEPTPAPEPAPKPEPAPAPRPAPAPAAKPAAKPAPAPAISRPAPARPPAAPSTKPAAPRPASRGYQTRLTATLIRPARPSYPSDARRLRQTGTVRVKLFINESGTVDRTEVVQSSGFASLDTAACAAARRYTFRPPVIDGQPAKSLALVPFTFTL